MTVTSELMLNTTASASGRLPCILPWNNTQGSVNVKLFLEHTNQKKAGENLERENGRRADQQVHGAKNSRAAMREDISLLAPPPYLPRADISLLVLGSCSSPTAARANEKQ